MWVGDLVAPLGPGPPPPLAGTVPPTALADPDSKFVQVNGVTVHYKDRHGGASASGSSTGRNGGAGNAAMSDGDGQADSSAEGHEDELVLLLLHGFNGSTFSWRYVMDELAATAVDPLLPTQGIRVIATDRPPFGLTQRPRVAPDTPAEQNPYSNEGAAALSVGLLDKLGAKRAVVVGHSAGAAVAMEMATRFPDRVAGLVFVAPALPDEGGQLMSPTLGAQLRLFAARAILAQDDPGVKYVRRVIGRQSERVAAGDTPMAEGGVKAEAIEGYLRPMKADDWDVGMLQTLRSVNFTTRFPYRHLRGVPVLFVLGERDEGLTRQAYKVAGVLEQRADGTTDVVELPGVGHMPMEEAPQQTIQAMKEWLQESLWSAERQRKDSRPAA